MRVLPTATLVGAVATSCLLHHTTAFTPPRTFSRIVAPASDDGGRVRTRCPPLSAGGPPVISGWRYESSKGTVSGTVVNHPTIPDGERITTSPVKNPDGMDENLVVQTRSGSKYKLTKAAFGAKIPAAEAKRAEEKEAKAEAAAAEKRRVAEERKAAAAEKKRLAEEKKAAAAAAKKAPSATASKKAPAATAKKANGKEAKAEAAADKKKRLAEEKKAAAAEKKRLAEEKKAVAAAAKKASVAEAASKKASAATAKKSNEKEAKAEAAADKKKRLVEEKKAAAAEKKRLVEEEKVAAAAAKKASVAEAKKASAAAAAAAPKKAAPRKAKASDDPLSSDALRALAKSEFSLTGTTVGARGKYLLAGTPRQSNGRAAKIWKAYLADPGVPDVPAGFDGSGDARAIRELTVKLSPDVERLRLENKNYAKVQSGFFSGQFVKKMEYVERIPSGDSQLDRKVSALVIESGEYDLKALLAARRGVPLRGKCMRDAAESAGRCIRAVHSSNLVWTDLKTENFVVVNVDNFGKEVKDAGGDMGLPGVKGIDLESVVRRGGNPIDYSPEACPPEFAQALDGGYGGEFVLEYSYDMWSLGMMLYELSTGRPYFDRKPPAVVTKLLCADNFEVDVSDVPDGKLRDLIGKCLSLEPKKRPDITFFLLHPYFITTGFGPFSF